MTVSILKVERSTSRCSTTALMAILSSILLQGIVTPNNVEAFHIAPSYVKFDYGFNFKPISKFTIGSTPTGKPHRLFAQPHDDHHPEMPYEQEGTGNGTGAPRSSRPTSTTPPRRMKHKNRKKKTRTKQGRAGRKYPAGMKSGPLTPEELALHVSSEYITGPGGLFKTADAKRKRQLSSSVANLVGGASSSSSSIKEQVEYLKKLDRHPALVLNADYQPLSVLPLSIWSWQDTVKALFSGKVRVVDTYPGVTIRAVNMDVDLPSVIALTEYVPQPRQNPAFTRRNVFLRDGYRCQYCAQRYHTQDLSLDHFVPRCVGGRLEWKNTVTCCKKCNSRKGSTMPNQLRSKGMKLIREPRIPTKFELAKQAGRMVPRRVHPSWRPFLQGYVKDDDDEEQKSASVGDDSRKYFEE